eukprot:GHVR01179033.1.p1 GENE.GHVR01179033.1~~GHVR01179033.1.p1  ORF type:complete len:338 (-),score=21.60 GHVR01179033.1:352-1365(-)
MHERKRLHILCVSEAHKALYTESEAKMREIGIDCYKLKCKHFPHTQAVVTTNLIQRKLVYVLFVYDTNDISNIFTCNKRGEVIVICTHKVMLRIPTPPGSPAFHRIKEFEYTFMGEDKQQHLTKLYVIRIKRAETPPLAPFQHNKQQEVRLDYYLADIHNRSTPKLNRSAGFYEMSTYPNYINPLQGFIKHMTFIGTGRRPTFLPECVTVTDYKWIETLAEHAPDLLYETQKWKFSQPTLRGLYDNIQKYDHPVLDETQIDLNVLEEVMDTMRDTFLITEKEMKSVRSATQSNISKLKRGITVEGFDMRKNPGFPYCMMYKNKGEAEQYWKRKKATE